MSAFLASRPPEGAAHGILRRCRPVPCNHPDQEDGSMLRRSAVESSATAQQSVPPIVHEVLRSAGQPLAADVRAFFEPLFNHDFSHVRVHTDAKAAESVHAVNAKAYTAGREVVFGTDEFAPGSREGRQTLAHELAHVIQQQAHPTDMPSVVSTPSDHAELEAVQAANAVVGGAVSFSLSHHGSAVNRQPPVGPPAALMGLTATREDFKNSGAPDGANCAAVKPAALGVDGPRAGANGMEMIFKLSGPVPAGTEFEITRTKATGTWEKDAAGTWSRLGGNTAGTSDDHHDDDECLVPIASKIYVVDTPGMGSLDARGQVFPDGTTISATATAGVRKHSFAEWVIARNKALSIGWTRISTPGLHRWHSIVSVADVAGVWTRVDTPSGKKNEIKLGSTSTTGLTP